MRTPHAHFGAHAPELLARAERLGRDLVEGRVHAARLARVARRGDRHQHADEAAVRARLALAWPDADTRRLVKAALTMNMTIVELQGRLATQGNKPTEAQLVAMARKYFVKYDRMAGTPTPT